MRYLMFHLHTLISAMTVAENPHCVSLHHVTKMGGALKRRSGSFSCPVARSVVPVPFLTDAGLCSFKDLCSLSRQRISVLHNPYQ